MSYVISDGDGSYFLGESDWGSYLEAFRFFKKEDAEGALKKVDCISGSRAQLRVEEVPRSSLWKTTWPLRDSSVELDDQLVIISRATKQAYTVTVGESYDCKISLLCSGVKLWVVPEASWDPKLFKWAKLADLERL